MRGLAPLNLGLGSGVASDLLFPLRPSRSPVPTGHDLSIMTEGRPRRSIGSTSYKHLLAPISLTDSSEEGTGSDSDSSAANGGDKAASPIKGKNGKAGGNTRGKGAKGKGKGKGKQVDSSEDEDSNESEFVISDGTGGGKGGASDDDDDDFSAGEEEVDSGPGEEDSDDEGSGYGDSEESGSDKGKGKRTGPHKSKLKEKAVKTKLKPKPKVPGLAIPEKSNVVNKRSQAPPQLDESGAGRGRRTDLPVGGDKYVKSLTSQFSYFAVSRITPPTRTLADVRKEEDGHFETARIESGEVEGLDPSERMYQLERWANEVLGPYRTNIIDLGWWKGKYEKESGKMKNLWGGWYDGIKMPSIVRLQKETEYRTYFPRMMYTSTPSPLYNATETAEAAEDPNLDTAMDVDAVDSESETAIKIFLGSLAGDEEQTLTTIERFEAKRLDSYLPGKPGHLLHAGGPVSSLSWCPTTDSLSREKEYLAVSTFSRTHPMASATASSYPSLIQIWSLDTSIPSDLHYKTNTDQQGEGMQLELGLCVSIGEPWDIKWCPKGGDGETAPKNEETSLGVLAGVFTDGSISLFAVPHPDKVRTGKGAQSKTAFIKAEPTLRLAIPGTHCSTFDWASHETIVAGCTNGAVAMWNVGQALRTGVATVRPIRYFPLHSAAIRSINALRNIPFSSDIDGSMDLDADPMTAITLGADGSMIFVDFRSSAAQFLLDHERGSYNASAYHAGMAVPLTNNMDDCIQAISWDPTNIGSKKKVYRHKGMVTSIATSDHHSFCISTSCDGTCIIANIVRPMRKKHHVKNAFRKLYRVDFNRITGEYKMFDNLKAEQSRGFDALNKKQMRDEAKPGETYWDTAAATAAWSPQVAVLRAAFHPNIRRSPLVASGMACGLVRVDWVEAVPIRPKAKAAQVAVPQAAEVASGPIEVEPTPTAEREGGAVS